MKSKSGRKKLENLVEKSRISPLSKKRRKEKKKKRKEKKGGPGRREKPETWKKGWAGQDPRVIYLHEGNESSTTCSRKSVRVENLILSPPPFGGARWSEGCRSEETQGWNVAQVHEPFSKLQPLFRAFNPSTRSDVEK